MKFLMPKDHPPMHFYELCFWRLFATTLAYLLLSLSYSLVSLAFQIPFSHTGPHPDTAVVDVPDAFGRGTFVVYWMLNFVGMCKYLFFPQSTRIEADHNIDALGLASENVTMVIGQPWTALWLSKSLTFPIAIC